MKKEVEGGSKKVLQGPGFAACYKGKTIATARSFDKLIDKGGVRELLGNRDLLIKHTVPEGIVVVY